KWESPAGKNHWKFTLLEDGAFLEIIRSDNQRMVLEEGGFEVERPDYLLRYIFGPCEWSYDEKTKHLKITIVIDHFYLKADVSELECMLIDTFEGPISEDGKIWTATWTNTMRFDPPKPDVVTPAQVIVFSAARD
ncbi:MAG: hypothetical protein ACYSO4_11020, partial [Planctomycetota bacterium]